jgi:hypothetical protein
MTRCLPHGAGRLGTARASAQSESALYVDIVAERRAKGEGEVQVADRNRAAASIVSNLTSCNNSLA